MSAKKPGKNSTTYGLSHSTTSSAAAGEAAHTTTHGTAHSQSRESSVDSLAPIREKLKEESQDLQAKADSLRSSLSVIDENLQRINSALAALNGSSPKAAAATSTADKKQRKAAAPAASKSQVLEFIKNELSAGDPIPVEELRARLEKRLADEGYSKLGFALRFKEALADKSLVDADGSISQS